MKKSLRIKTTAFSDLSIVAFSAKFGEIVQAIGANIDVFTDPPVGIAQLNTAAQDLATKVYIAEEGSQADRNARDIQASVCLTYLYQLAAYVLNVAASAPTLEEQIAVVELAKFVPAKTGRTPAGQLPAPGGIQVKSSGIPGIRTVEARWAAVRGAHSYIVQSTTGHPESSETVWQDTLTTTKSKAQVELPEGVNSVRVVAVGSAGLSLPSAYVTVLVG